MRRSATPALSPKIPPYVEIWAVLRPQDMGWVEGRANCQRDVPQLLRCDSTLKNNWLRIKTIGTKSNRSGIGARIYCQIDGGRRLIDEVRSGSSYCSQNDLRVYFGLAKAEKADLEIRWPSGIVDKIPGVKANQTVTVVEGKGLK